MPRLLAAWIGDADLRAAATNNVKFPGPIVGALRELQFDELLLLTNREIDKTHELRDGTEVRIDTFRDWLQTQRKTKVHLTPAPLSSPIHFGEIYQAARQAVENIRARNPTLELTFHVSPGTPAMGAVWIILAKTVFLANLIQSSPEAGVGPVDFPFELTAAFLPDLLRRPDKELARLAAGIVPAAPEFEAIIHNSVQMRNVITRARRAAVRSVPVLLEGETGTGKELFARAIHCASPRSNKPFKVANCGAIPAELMESTIFGHKRGAFTSATSSRKGLFEEAHGGTLFLDEIGELPLGLQVKLLRVLDEGKVTPVGTNDEIPVDVRIISATNRTLLSEVANKRFREDLFYRLAVAAIHIPPLRDRGEDKELLVEGLLDQVNKESTGEPGYAPKTLTPAARHLLLQHRWPGNVRELLNTLRRAAVWSDGSTIDAGDVRAALFKPVSRESEDSQENAILEQPLGDGFHLEDLLGTIEKHYLERAMKAAGNNKSEAARLLGIPSYVTLTNRLQKHGISPRPKALRRSI